MYRRGSALLLVLVTLILLSLEVAMIGLIAIRGFGNEGMLMSQNITARRAAETAVGRLHDRLETYLATSSPSGADTWFAQGQTGAINNVALTLENPDGGGATSEAQISAWIKERRGNLYHIIGRAQIGSIDILVHRWILTKVCGQGGLITIMTTRNTNTDSSYHFLEDDIAATDDGRVVFGEETGKVRTWKQGVGISTIPAPYNQTIRSNLTVGTDGRFFFGSDSSSTGFFTWKEDTGLSTIAPSLAYPGVNSSLPNPSTGGIIFSSGASSGPLMAWKPNGTATGSLTTIATGYFTGDKGQMKLSSTGRLFIGENWSSRNFYTWKDGFNISTIVTGQDSWGGIAIANDGTVLFGGENISSGKYYKWIEDGTASGNLSTIVPADSQLTDFTDSQIGPDGRIYVGLIGNSYSDNCWTYNAGTMTTILGASCSNIQVDSSNNVFFRTYASPGFVKWKSGSGATTITTDGDMAYYGQGNTFISPDDARVYFTGGWDKIWTWKNGVLSVLMDVNATQPVSILGMLPNGRVFFNKQGTNGQLWTWKESTGLSTIISSTDASTDPGYDFTLSNSTGWAFFGENLAPGRFWAWQEPQPCDLN